MVIAVKIISVLALSTLVSGSAIPIWELLTQQEKMGRLMYVFIHLVDQYCKDSSIPDCQKILTLYGMSNLVNEEENSLDYMDPYQRDSRNIIWTKVMKGDFKLPSYKTFYPDDVSSNVPTEEEDYDLVNEVQDRPYYNSPNKIPNDPHPYAVRVPAPAKIAAAYANAASTGSQTPVVRIISEPSSTPTNVPGPVGIKPSADFEPMMTDSRPAPVFIRQLMPSSNSASSRLLSRSKRTAELFPEDEFDILLEIALEK
ncbi:hypothetical protein SK128_014968 [Halocaridina rubra]|uniref:Rhythmically expressed gene 5 protein n=1 Tax=Halocaridina rubra TaxID=373956 RepID=A0AAN9A7Z6_HALRR